MLMMEPVTDITQLSNEDLYKQQAIALAEFAMGLENHLGFDRLKEIRIMIRSYSEEIDRRNVKK